MTALKIIALDTAGVRALQTGSMDAFDNKPEHHKSDGKGNPCRHCLTDIAEGEGMLIFSHRPFDDPQAHAEVGPIFVHSYACEHYDEGGGLPPLTRKRDQYLIRAYTVDNRIVYGAGGVVNSGDLETKCQQNLALDTVAYLHIRSASYNCYQFRVEGS